MTMDDVALGLRLTRQAGWNQLESDWRRFLNLGPEGCFVAELDGHPVGTTMTFVSDRVAWVAMVLVEEGSRGKGIGTALLKHALNYLDAYKIKTVRLDATHLGQPIYEKLGFMPEYELVRFEGVVPTGLKTQDSRLKHQVLGLESEVVGLSLIEFDRQVTGENRAKMLGALFKEFPQSVRVLMRGDRVEGFVTMRPGRNAIQIGPCVATEEAGLVLLSDALSRCVGKSVFVDVPTDNIHAVKVAEASELVIQRHFLRMYRGERVKDNVRAIWASSGPEKG
jgi:GNAT superfamily N-acetyltransferase